MKYREIEPSPEVREFIKCYWTLKDGEEVDRDFEPIVPDGCPEIVFNLNVPFRRTYQGKLEFQPKSIVVGQMKSVVTILPTGKIDLFGVRFWPHGLRSILKDNVDEITGTIESASSVFGSRGENLEVRINTAANDKERIKVFEGTFRDELLSSDSVSKETVVALRMIRCDPSGVRINRIAKELGVSVKLLERRFKREVGLTPKFLARLFRVQKLLSGFNGYSGANWTEICYEHGFSDQSHMIREFRSIAGAAPAAFVRQKRAFSDLYTG